MVFFSEPHNPFEKNTKNLHHPLAHLKIIPQFSYPNLLSIRPMYHQIHTPSATYQFTLHPADAHFHRLSGIYIFVIVPQPEAPSTDDQLPNTFYHLLYIGITNNFQSRLKQHHKIAAAMHLGMTHIGILKITSGKKRKKIERDILKHLNPPLNQTWLTDIRLS